MRIAMLAPPWITVPPRGYGGIEHMVALLTDQLVDDGHHVTLFAPPGSTSKARVHPVLSRPYPTKINHSLHEMFHVSRALSTIEGRTGWHDAFDVIHDHTTAGPAIASYIKTPVVHTVHNGHEGERGEYYRQHCGGARLVVVSEAQRRSAPEGLEIAGVVPLPIRLSDWPLRERKQDFALWMARFDPAKGAHRAIQATRWAGIKLILAGPVQAGQETYFKTKIEPHIDGTNVQYVGEAVGRLRVRLLADARCLLMPIRWNEPGGTAMIEALACGTPVVAFPEGAANDHVLHGQNGFLVSEEAHMADAIALAGDIDPRTCRKSVERYSPERVAAGYLEQYRKAIAHE